MDNRAEIRDFLATRRAKVTPEQVGLPPGSGRRRVPGLRREEVAVLAGVSPEWYVRLEKGHISGVSDDVLTAVARALQLDEAERLHLFDLARAAKPARTTRRRTTQPQVRPSVVRMLESMGSIPAFVRTGRLDILAVNAQGRALYSPMFDHADEAGAGPANLARFTFFDPAAKDFIVDWEASADGTVAVLRAESGRNPYDRQTSDLVGELATRSDAFRTRWAAHDVGLHRSGLKHFHHPVVGRIDVTFDSLDVTADTGLTLTAYSAEPGSASEDALKLLASWAATRTEEARTEEARAPHVTVVDEHPR